MVYFSHQDPANPETKVNFELTRMNHQRWSLLIPDPEVDADSHAMELKRLTGESRHTIKQATMAMFAMQSLGNLRIVQETHYHLSIPYLARIIESVAQAGKELWPELDRRIVERLTPRVVNEVLMEASTLAGLITRWIKELDPKFTGRKKRADGEEEFVEFRHGEGMTSFRGVINGAEGKRFHQALKKVSNGKMTLAEALLAFLVEKAPVKVVQYVFTPLTGGVSWIPGTGFLSLDDSVKWGEMKSKTIDLDEVATRVEKGYTPSPELRMYVMARDGQCMHPGCTVTAENCQLDHVVPYGLGGPTVAWNLTCLCQHHHNAKTDGRLKSSINSVGEVEWIGPCNRPVVERPVGPLAQEMPTGIWGQTLRSRMEARFAAIRASSMKVAR